MLSRYKLGDRQEEVRQDKEEEDADNAPICPESSEEEEKRHKAPDDEVDSKSEGECSFIPSISTFDIQGGYQEHGVAKPEGAITAVHSCSKGIPNAEFHDTGYKLGKATHKDSQPKHSLIRPDLAVVWVGMW